MFLDEEVYNKLTESDVIDNLNDITMEHFLLLRDQLKHILKKEKEKDENIKYGQTCME